MSAYFVKPEAFTVVSAPQLSATTPATNLALDHPGRIWTSSSATTATIVIQGAGQLVDTIALCGSTLLATDTIKVSFGTTAALAASNAATATGVAWSGTKDASVSATGLIRFAATAFNFCQIVITATAARSISAQRLVIGSAVVAGGIGYDAKQTFEDPSVEVGGTGYSAWETYPTVMQWAVTISYISEADWQSKWYGLLSYAGQSRSVFFNPDDLNNYQSGLTFGRFTSIAQGTIPGWNNRAVALAIKNLAT